MCTSMYPCTCMCAQCVHVCLHCRVRKTLLTLHVVLGFKYVKCGNFLCEMWELITCSLPVYHALVSTPLPLFSPTYLSLLSLSHFPLLLPIYPFPLFLPSSLSPFFSLLALSTFFSLGLIFCHLGVRDPRSFVVICHRLRLAKEVGMTSTIALDVEKVSTSSSGHKEERRKEERRKEEGGRE